MSEIANIEHKKNKKWIPKEICNCNDQTATNYWKRSEKIFKETSKPMLNKIPKKWPKKFWREFLNTSQKSLLRINKEIVGKISEEVPQMLAEKLKNIWMSSQKKCRMVFKNKAAASISKRNAVAVFKGIYAKIPKFPKTPYKTHNQWCGKFS